MRRGTDPFRSGGAFGRLPINLLPDLSYPSLTVETKLAGAAPSEVETLVTRPLEEIVGVVSGVQRLTSVSRPGLSQVTLEFGWGQNMDFASIDVREKLDTVRLPREADKPVLLRFDPSNDPVARLFLAGDADLYQLRYVAEEVLKKDLESTEGIAAIKVSGGYEDEIQVYVDEGKLSLLGLSIAEVNEKLMRENVNQAGGSLYEEEARYLVRANNEFESLDDILNTVLVSNGGRQVKIGDVATVERGHKKREVITGSRRRRPAQAGAYSPRQGWRGAAARASGVRSEPMGRGRTSDPLPGSGRSGGSTLHLQVCGCGRALKSNFHAAARRATAPSGILPSDGPCPAAIAAGLHLLRRRTASTTRVQEWWKIPIEHPPGALPPRGTEVFQRVARGRPRPHPRTPRRNPWRNPVSQARESVFEILEGDSPGPVGTAVRHFIQALIIGNVAAVVLGTVASVQRNFGAQLAWFELFSVAIFTLEYGARLIICTQQAAYSAPLLGRLRFAVTPFMLLDLLAIAPAFVPFFFGLDLRMARALRLMRIFRILKLARYSKAVHRLGQALRQSAAEIGVTLFAGSLILILAATCLYYLEREAQPEAFSSIPAAAWWAVATLTTVGYGDVSPATPLGKLAASGVAVLGVGVVALPAGILASAFASTTSEPPTQCPHCGEQLDEA